MATATAQDFSGGAWVRGCEEVQGGPYVVICDGYGGALFDARRPADCEFGSRFACRRTRLCDLARVMTIRDWSGAALSRSQLGCDAAGGDEKGEEPADPLERCNGLNSSGICKRCILQNRPDLAICKGFF